MDYKELGLEISEEQKQFLESNPEINEDRLLKNSKGEVFVYFPLDEFMKVYKKGE